MTAAPSLIEAVIDLLRVWPYSDSAPQEMQTAINTLHSALASLPQDAVIVRKIDLRLLIDVCDSENFTPLELKPLRDILERPVGPVIYQNGVKDQTSPLPPGGYR